jgi:phosphinothricin acetyltransferase
LNVRCARRDDVEAIAAIYTPIVRETAVSFELEPPGVEEMAARIERGRQFVPWLVATSDGRVAGYAYASRFRERPAYRWTCETSVYVDPRHQRTGVGRVLMIDLLGDLESRGFRNVLAVITLPNPASVAFHASLGFRRIGSFPRAGFKAGAWHDTEWWHRELVLETSPPSEPPCLGPLAAG